MVFPLSFSQQLVVVDNHKHHTTLPADVKRHEAEGILSRGLTRMATNFLGGVRQVADRRADSSTSTWCRFLNWSLVLSTLKTKGLVMATPCLKVST
jgi:hypothetical protein